MDKRHRLELVGITYNQIESGVYALILQQVGTNRRIPIIIGYPEAQAIQCKLQNVAPPRPFCHDTMLSTLNTFGISLQEVNIKKLPNGVFAADLIFSDGISTQIIDSRSSDAIALAIRVGAPIYTSEDVMKEASFEPKKNAKSSDENEINDTQPQKSQSSTTPDLSSLSIDQLTKAMTEAAENENYEEAARIKAELDMRNLHDKK